MSSKKDFEIKKEIQKNDTSDSEFETNEHNGSYDSSSDDEKMSLCMNLTARMTYKPTPEEKLKLANMFINLRHEAPPQHEIENTAGTRALRLREREQFENYVSLKTGTFSQAEDKIIRRNWRAFCMAHDWDPKNVKPFLQMKYKNKEFFLSLRNRIKFVQFIADGLFNRSLYSVYNRFKVMFDPHKVSRYSETEDRIIIDFIQKFGNSKIGDRKFADLALILKRTRASVWRRYRLLKKKVQEQSENVTSC